MTTVHCARDLPASHEEAERLWCDVDRWGAFVEGFGAVVSRSGEWPLEGAVVVWDSTPHGRGRVTERVREREAGVGQLVELQEERLTGTRRVWFGDLEHGVRVSLELDYRLRGPRLRTVWIDWLFVRRALQDSVERELEAFGRELLAGRLPSR
jgi:hypothetical protein